MPHSCASLLNVKSTYLDQIGGNKLLKVDDWVVNNPNMPGFKDETPWNGYDYTYDDNGNMKSDFNKKIDNITYNHLNLPKQITIQGKGTIDYIYDAAGNKLQKTVVDNTQAVTKTSYTYYAGAFIYKRINTSPMELETINHEEGRLRPKKIDEQQPLTPANITYIYDYFMKDHLGNVRMTLTTEQQTDLYAATMELANATKEEALFNNLASTRTDKPGGFDNDGANAKVIRLNGDINTGGNKRVGPSIVLKVMAGDAISISTQAWYQGSTQAPPANLPPLVNELAGLLTNGILSNGGDKSGTNTVTAITDWVTPILTGFENNKTYDNSKPKAYLNWVIVDEEFKEVLSSNHKGALQVNVTSGNMKQLLVGLNNLTIRRNGWLYVYISNESNMNVYFDDLIVNHKRSPVVAAQDYFPFGMEIAGLSTKAIGFGGGSENRNKFNKGSELQNKEFSDGSGLEWYSTYFRMYDPQIGRWNRIDPKPNEMMSQYVGMDNNPISFNDPLGDTVTIRHRTGFLGIFGKFANYRYDNGKLYNSSGTEIQRGATKRYVQKAAGALDALRTGGTNGQKLVTDLQNSTQNTYVMKGAENKFNNGGGDGAKGSDGQLLRNVVRWSPGNGQSGLDQNGNLNRPGFIGLGHELAHAYDNSVGGVQNNPWFTIPANLIPGGNDGNNISKGTAELFATHIENQIRAENNLSLRVNYMQQIINDPTTGLPFGLIIIPGTRTNANTFSANGITYTNPTY